MVTRDNVRQSIIDDVSVRAALTQMKIAQVAIFADLDLNDVAFMGHSLGAITGVSAFAIANATTGIDALDKPMADLFHFSSGSFASAGAGFAPLLFHSPTFGPMIKGLILAQASEDFKKVYRTTCAPKISIGDCFKGFIRKVPSAVQKTIKGQFDQFSVAAQTLLDTADPLNLGSLVTKDSAFYLAFGEGDQTVPNLSSKRLVKALSAESLKVHALIPCFD